MKDFAFLKMIKEIVQARPMLGIKYQMDTALYRAQKDQDPTAAGGMAGDYKIDLVRTGIILSVVLAFLGMIKIASLVSCGSRKKCKCKKCKKAD